MRDEDKIVRERQLAIRRELDRRHIALKVISFDSGIPYSTLLSYFPAEGEREPATISGAAIFALVGVIPADLLSLLLPEGWQLTRADQQSDADEITDRLIALAKEAEAKRSGNVTSIESELDARLAARRTLRGAA